MIRPYYERTWDVNIDPSFPSQKPEHKLVLNDCLGDPKWSLKEWINNGPTPDKEVDIATIDLMRLRILGRDFGISGSSEMLTEKDLNRMVRHDRIVDIEETYKDFRKFKVLIPVVDFGWEGRSVEGLPMHGTGLARQLALSAKLVNLPQTHDLQTKKGMRATYQIAFQGQNSQNQEQFFFVRESILRDMLSKHGYDMIWAVWGEREVSYKQLERMRSDSAELRYANYQAIYRY